MNLSNPFDALFDRLARIEEKLDLLDEKTIEQPEPTYTVKEVAQLFRVSEQTIRKKIELGLIDADTNTRPFLISKSALYDENNRLKKIRYCRNPR